MSSIECNTEGCAAASVWQLEHYDKGHEGYYCDDCALDVIAEGMD